MNDLFFHECRAAGLVFKTSQDWFKWLEENAHDVCKAVAEHDGFKYTINDVCINPNVKASYKIDAYFHFKATTAKTQFGWIWGYNYTLGASGSSSPCAYPSRYDSKTQFFETETDALVDALGFIIRQLEGKNKKHRTKNVSILIYYAKKHRMDIKHPQLELFNDQ